MGPKELVQRSPGDTTAGHLHAAAHRCPGPSARDDANDSETESPGYSPGVCPTNPTLIFCGACEMIPQGNRNDHSKAETGGMPFINQNAI